MIHRKRTRPQNKNKIIFSTGAVLFLLGFLGMIYNLWINPSSSASDFLPGDTVVFAEFNTKKSDIKNLNDSNFTDLIDDVLSQNLPNISKEDLLPWVGEKIALAWLPENNFILSAKYRDKKEAKKFMQKFLTDNEKFTEKNFAGFTVYSPSFSSQIQFVFKDKWLVVASSEEAVLSILKNKLALSQSDKYNQIKKDLPRKSDIIGYVNLEELSSLTNVQISAKKPFIKAFTKTIPGFGLNIKFTPEGLDIKSKFLTTEGVFSTELLEKTPNEVIPELAQYSPQDILFFMNGYDLKAKYLHTKNFLEKFHPQFSLIFDGILRAKFKEIFGENFDFQTDFLDRVRGQYAIILNFVDKETPFTYFTLITKFGDGTALESSEDMKIIIKKAQQHYSTKIVSHNLPDGTSRKELVIADPTEIDVSEKSANSYSYFTAETETEEGSTIPKQKFSYGFLNNFLIFSNHENGVKDVFNAYTNKVNLTKNEDFRESVLFKFSAAESYGFVNSNKLTSLLNFSRETIDPETEEQSFDFASLIKGFRNFSFARKTFPQEVLFSAFLRKR